MIRILDKQTADKIAAGEVVERPVSIVKELVENSIDAKATSVVVEIKNGGKSYIRVTDNGTGIPGEDTQKAFLRHATSKITKAKDLEAIGTLGISRRGPRFCMRCKQNRAAHKDPRRKKQGTRLIIHGGEVISSQEDRLPRRNYSYNYRSVLQYPRASEVYEKRWRGEYDDN